MNTQERGDEMIENYIDNMKQTQYFCLNCKQVPLITISPENSSFVNCECYCTNKWKVSFKDIFRINWIQTNVFQNMEDDSTEDSEVLFDIEITKMNNILKYLKVWNRLIKQKKLKDLFELKLNQYCQHGFKFKEVEYYCHTCKQHICKVCYDISHKEHKADALGDFLNIDKLQEKLDILEDVKKLRIKQNVVLFDSMNSILKKVIGNMKEDSIIRESINKVRCKLIKAYTESRILNECLFIFVRLQADMFRILESNNNYNILKNLRDNNYLFLDNDKIIDSINEKSPINEIVNKVNQVSNYLNEHLLIKTTEQVGFKELFYQLNKLQTIPINQIKLELSKNYGKHTVQINQILLLQNGNIAVASTRKKIKVFSQNHLSKKMKYKGHKGPVNCLCLFGEDHFLSGSDDGRIMRWGIRTAMIKFEIGLKLSSSLYKGKKIVKDIGKVLQIITIGKNKFASISEDKTIRIFSETKEIQEVAQMKEDTSTFISIISIDERLCTASIDDNLRFWNLKTLSMNETDTISEVECLGNNSLAKLNSKIILVGGKNGLTLVDSYRNIVMMRVSETNLQDVTAFLTLSNSSFICVSKRFFYEYDIKTSEIKMIIKSPNSHSDIVTSLVRLGDNAFFSGGFDSMINKWSFSIGE